MMSVSLELEEMPSNSITWGLHRMTEGDIKALSIGNKM